VHESPEERCRFCRQVLAAGKGICLAGVYQHRGSRCPGKGCCAPEMIDVGVGDDDKGKVPGVVSFLFYDREDLGGTPGEAGIDKDRALSPDEEGVCMAERDLADKRSFGRDRFSHGSSP